jgi:hypothetical protein
MELTHARLSTRLRDEQGTALIIALMSMMLLTALGAAVVMVTNTETMIANNHRSSQEAIYAADAAVERVVQDLLMVPRWNDVLAGTLQSSFIDGGMSTSKTLPGGGTIALCCGTNSATAQLQADTDSLNLWGGNDPQWRLFAWGPMSELLPDANLDSPYYLAVWVADDPADAPPGAQGEIGTVPDNNPALDANGVLTLHAEAIGPTGARKVVEVTVARTASTEIERGQIAQRGQEELNQRARKAAVGIAGKAIGSARSAVD